MCGEKAGSQGSIFRVQQILGVGTVSSGDGVQLKNRGSYLKPGHWYKNSPVSSSHAAGTLSSPQDL